MQQKANVTKQNKKQKADATGTEQAKIQGVRRPHKLITSPARNEKHDTYTGNEDNSAQKRKKAQIK